MSEPVAIRAEHLSKTFRLFDGPGHRLASRLGLATPRLVTAVRDVSFELRRGRALGVVGDNGAGKSTLLRMLAGITRPTQGRCRVEGRAGEILELGAGFHPELTGRQNIRLSAALAGLPRDRVEEVSEEIIAFAELVDFIDEPVKRYSSGMAVRLAFAIATQSRADVLIVDEALSVGDGRFQRKCLDRMREFLVSGGTLVFCSHALYYVTSICDEALWLRDGEVAAHGDATEVARVYGDALRASETSHDGASEAAAGPAREATSDDAPPVRLVSARLLGGDGAAPPSFVTGARWGVEVEIASTGSDQPVHVAIGVNTPDEREVFACATHRDGHAPIRGPGEHRIRLWAPRLPLRSGEFTLYVYLLDEAGLHVHDRARLPRAFRVAGGGWSPALIDLPHDWERPGQ